MSDNPFEKYVERIYREIPFSNPGDHIMYVTVDGRVFSCKPMHDLVLHLHGGEKISIRFEPKIYEDTETKKTTTKSSH